MSVTEMFKLLLAQASVPRSVIPDSYSAQWQWFSWCTTFLKVPLRIRWMFRAHNLSYNVMTYSSSAGNDITAVLI